MSGLVRDKVRATLNAGALIWGRVAIEGAKREAASSSFEEPPEGAFLVARQCLGGIEKQDRKRSIFG